MSLYNATDILCDSPGTVGPAPGLSSALGDTQRPVDELSLELE